MIAGEDNWDPEELELTNDAYFGVLFAYRLSVSPGPHSVCLPKGIVFPIQV